MKYLLQHLVLNMAALYITSVFFGGLIITGGILQYLYAALLLFIGFFVVKPIITLITLPISFLTLGLFSIVVTAFVTFLITIFDRNFVIQSFTFQGYNINIFLSYVLISVTIQVIYKSLVYVFDL